MITSTKNRGRAVRDRITQNIIYSSDGNNAWIKWLDLKCGGCVQYDSAHYTDGIRSKRRTEIQKRNDAWEKQIRFHLDVWSAE